MIEVSQTKALSMLGRVLRFGRRVLRGLEGDTRSQQLRDEVQFWRDWFSTKGLQWPEDYKERLDPQYPIQGHIARYIDLLQQDPVSILDVGSGPLTKLGKLHVNKEIRITAVDLLAPHYDRVLTDFGISPLVRTIFGDAAKLLQQFGEDKFDIVHGQNSIDHTEDPIQAIRQMIAVTKPGGFVVLFHVENEGKNEGYKQLHKWDFTCERGRFLVKGPGPTGRSVDVGEALAHLGSTECSLDDGAVLVTIRKHTTGKSH
jgi:SAM-dependent methyltransferase